ncbi:MAG: phosphotransferase [Bacteroidales bacterium]|nr:phosphotransferase [Bacteroidales bacterium]MBQ7018511.1 phosphotransferase [Bacteroidales bacterium]
MKELEKLFEEYTRQKPENIYELPSSGSNRRYFRITGSGMSLIGAKGLDVDENIAFMEIAKHFRLKGLPVPQVLCASEDKMFYLQEDLGDITLFNTIQQGRETSHFSPDEIALLKKTIATLPKLQFEGGKGLDYNVCFPQPEFDERNVWFDCNYFKYCFLKTTGIEFSEIKLHDDLTKMAADLLEGGNEETFMYRDFQARNVMLVDGNPYFIDFQGGRKGPLYYDLASFVWQAKANYPTSLKEELIETYREALKKYVDIPRETFYKKLRLFVLFRTMQVLGAYGFRGYFEKKPHFLQSVPFAIDNLRKLIQEEPFYEYPYIQQLLVELTNMRQFSDLRAERKLEVRIFSFSYKKGIPVDTSGNGGGYVFDCRAINNPGKYDHFKHFTGLDKEVIEFLETDGEVTKFLSHVYDLADAHVTRYMERKFTNLMFSFGCTGGQHRSVYCAQHLAEYLAKKYNITVKVYHREQDISQEF